MRIAVIGAGLLGVTTAWFLAESGHEVVVIDREEGPGLESSFANGGMLTPSQAAPWNTPGILWQILKWIGREDSPFLLKPSQLFALAGWGTAFLCNSQADRFRLNQQKNIRLGLYSLSVLRKTRQQLQIQYDQSTVGTMKIYRTLRAMEESVNLLRDYRSEQVKFQILDGDGVVGLEPALSAVRKNLAGGIFFPDDESGDARQFCHELALAGSKRGVRFMYKTSVMRLVRSANRIKAVQTSSGNIEADTYILAAGSDSPILARSVGLHLPIYPVKGYSLTMETANQALLPVLPIIDELRHVAITPLGNRLRISGKAELAGYDMSVDESRIQLLLKFLNEIYPDLKGSMATAAVQKWACLRPYSSDGVPIMGPCQIDNLFLNTGHGHLGWTLAAGSARLIADLITGGKPDLDIGPYLLSRFH